MNPALGQASLMPAPSCHHGVRGDGKLSQIHDNV